MITEQTAQSMAEELRQRGESERAAAIEALVEAARDEAIPVLERLYTFRVRARVVFFLEENPFLVEVLLTAHGVIDSYFPGAQSFLEVVTDPETIDDRQLLLSIATELPATEAVERLEGFDRDWWLDAAAHAQGKLCINVE